MLVVEQLLEAEIFIVLLKNLVQAVDAAHMKMNEMIQRKNLAVTGLSHWTEYLQFQHLQDDDLEDISTIKS